MKVINVKVKYIRPQYKHLKEWCDSTDNVYIGRKLVVFIPMEDGTKRRYPEKDSILHNPYAIGKTYNGIKVENRDIACDMFYKYMNKKLDEENVDGVYHTAIKNLKGKNLGCWCHELRCHGDELIKIYNERFDLQN